MANAAVPRKGAASRPLGCRSDEGHGDVARILRLAFVRPQPTPGAQRALRTLTCTKTHALLQVGRRARLRKCLARTNLFSVGEWLVAGVLAPALAGQRPRHQPKCSAPAPNKMNSHDHFFARAFWSCHNNIEGQGQKPFQGCTKKASGYAPSAKECGRWARERRVPCDEAAVDAGGEAAALARHLTADQRIRCRAS